MCTFKQLNIKKKKNPYPHLCEKYALGLHIVRRSDRYWAGLFTDLVIELVLMRSIKTQGGLMCGKAMTEIQRATWVPTMPTCSSVNESMQKYSGVEYASSELHKEASSSRQVRDSGDALNIISYLQERDPFTQTDGAIRNIANDMTGNDKVDVYDAKVKGEIIVASMAGKCVNEYIFHKND